MERERGQWENQKMCTTPNYNYYIIESLKIILKRIKKISSSEQEVVEYLFHEIKLK